MTKEHSVHKSSFSSTLLRAVAGTLARVTRRLINLSYEIENDYFDCSDWSFLRPPAEAIALAIAGRKAGI